jgi:hypothetical protein
MLRRPEYEMTSSISHSSGSTIFMPQLPTEEALLWARLYHREQVAQAERDHLANTVDRPARSHILVAGLVGGPKRVAVLVMLLIGFLAVAVV